MVKLLMPGSKKKREPPWMLEDQVQKRRKMDRSVKQQCGKILKTLMTHKYGWVFKEPVDPVALKIPDYFLIISHPMDLGTVKDKLEDNVYLDVKEFAADVRLTFYNAILYNPPSCDVHWMAKELDNIFSRSWKSLEAKWGHESKNVKQEFIANGRVKNTEDTKEACYSLLPKTSMSYEEKKSLRNELVEASRGKMAKHLQGFLRKFGLICYKEEKIEKDFGSIDDETLWELRKVINSFLDGRAEKTEPAKVTQNDCRPLAGKVLLQGTDDDMSAYCPAKTKPSLRSVTSNCGSCGGVTCRCNLQKDSAKASSTDLSSERSFGRDHGIPKRMEPLKVTQNGRRLLAGKVLPKGTDDGNRSAYRLATTKPSLSSVTSNCGSCGGVTCQCNLRNDSANASSTDLFSARSFGRDHRISERDSEIKSKPTFHTSKSDPDSDGAVSTLDSEHFLSSSRDSTPATAASSGEERTPLIDVQLSPKKALRASMLKSRFADTIFKAKHKTLLDHGKADPLKMQLEKERLERQQREEREKIEAQIRDAEAESKMQQERKREAARIALEKMERTVIIDDNLEILKEIEVLIRSPADPYDDTCVSEFGAMDCGLLGKPLERLGLVLKEENIGDEYEDDDGEEGEIIS